MLHLVERMKVGIALDWGCVMPRPPALVAMELIRRECLGRESWRVMGPMKSLVIFEKASVMSLLHTFQLRGRSHSRLLTASEAKRWVSLLAVQILKIWSTVWSLSSPERILLQFFTAPFNAFKMNSSQYTLLPIGTPKTLRSSTTSLGSPLSYENSFIAAWRESPAFCSSSRNESWSLLESKRQEARERCGGAYRKLNHGPMCVPRGVVLSWAW